MMRKLLCTLLCFTAFIQCVLPQTDRWLTRFEMSGGTETPRYDETVAFCQDLASASPAITWTTFGKSAQGRDLPLMIFDRDGLSDPDAIRQRGRIVVLIEACIHAGEPDGKDAGLMLIRDLVLKKIPVGFLNNLSILFIPIFNTDGHERFGPFNRINQNGPREMGWRTTANNLNLNRDFLKADAPEMKAWLRLFNKWLPDFFIDTHTTDGADYQYTLTYLMEIYGEMDPGLTKWASGSFIPALTSRLDTAGNFMFPYVDFRNWHDPRSGLITEVAPPMLSQGYVALRNRPGILIETHMLKSYQKRVNATYHCILATLEILADQHDHLKKMVNQADDFTRSEQFISQPFTLQFETLMSDSVMVEFKGIDYEVEKSSLSNGNWFRYGTNPVLFKLPYFYKTRPLIQVQLPQAYIIPPEWGDIIEKLRIHGIQMTALKKDTILPIRTCRFKNPKWQTNSYEGHHPMSLIDYDEFSENRWFPKGSMIVELRQQAGRVIPQMLEPRGDGSLVYWGFFDAIMEQKEYGESYVIEKMAAEMLARDPQLKVEFERKKAGDSLFAGNPQQILNWFYNKSPYSDSRKGIYPIGKIMDNELLERLKSR